VERWRSRRLARLEGRHNPLALFKYRKAADEWRKAADEWRTVQRIWGQTMLK
jgi:hypothetical protein